MTEMNDINALLEAPPSLSEARQLTEWADFARLRILRGDMGVGILVPEEVAKIPTAYRAAAQSGDTEAWVKLAWWCALPEFGEPNLETAEESLQKASEAGVKSAPLELVKLRWFFKRETASERERQWAYRTVATIVEGNPQHGEATYFLALLTTHGFGVAASPEAGFRLQQKAAELGNADAMFELFIHYATGLGVSEDQDAAFRACRRAAEAGHSRAMYNLGAFNASGRGTRKNIPGAIKWYEMAADAGNPNAMAGLAVIYATGDGIEADPEYAQQLFDQAEYCGLETSRFRQQVGF